ncbi:hypothetical protein CAXC1_240009 [Candidatus Xenohaliotis californiensis]|uniref:Uncharacterized protein n=1 Tax=Candidatus Xenohaliotis californiensis TaxID=84677 RepID=A0ABP0ESL0_9RICK|nr:hypothetical protein CAXC1_240009 [Candidatus Xenohaliotis californiensis]
MLITTQENRLEKQPLNLQNQQIKREANRLKALQKKFLKTIQFLTQLANKTK